MGKKLNRREFVRATAAAGVAAAGIPKALHAHPATSSGQGPVVMTPKSVKPCVVASSNGNRSKDEKGVTCIERAFKMITGGSDVLDALVSGVSIVELDPNQSGVGWSGLPNAEGVVQLDASCMHGPRKRAGAVAGIEGVRTPARVAQYVADETDHHLLVGKGAQEFARAMGFKIEDGLINENARKQWLEWKRRTDPLHYLSPKDRAQAGYDIGLQMVREGLIDGEHFWGTINCDGISPKGEICGVTTTSGLSFKIPGRAGDSPILGAGLYVDGEVGAAGSTGRGEANLYNLASFMIVDEMRRGAHPKDACLTALKRVAKNTIEKRLLNEKGNPKFQLNFYCLNAKGEHAGVAMYQSTY
ncbi:MAG TPA: N(4)-(beta-N-acetylglucosaminyl)-L-asparaginase, partial [Vicinamibacterales bacterium]|nr:N(4)-(beta-N-acetylglucosaminyl)-L-asparaginase [Vicinamibacterales bacterium]